MARPLRLTEGGYAYHVSCYGLKTKPIFRTEEDYVDFERLLIDSVERYEPRLLSYCVLPKHWHAIVVPRKDGDLSRWVGWLLKFHSARWHTKPRRAGTGALYERRFKSFPVQDNARLLDAMQFVESHPFRTEKLGVHEDWRWSSLTLRKQESVPHWLSMPPVAIPNSWQELCRTPMDPEIEQGIQVCIQRGRPYGDETWVQKSAVRLKLESTLRPRGRPRKPSIQESKGSD